MEELHLMRMDDVPFRHETQADRHTRFLHKRKAVDQQLRSVITRIGLHMFAHTIS
jgi:hypothetical protein